MHKDEAETFGTHWLGISKRSLETAVRRSVLALLLLELAFATASNDGTARIWFVY